MEYKYSTINEVNHFEFGEAVVGDIQLTERMFHLVLDNVKICPENSCNRDIRMMRTNELLFKISDAEIISLVEEGYNEYDADGNLKHTYPDEDTKLDKTASKAQISQPKASPSKKPDAKKLKLGDAVKVVSLNLRGIVSSLPNARGDLFVQMGILRSQVNINDLELIDDYICKRTVLDFCIKL